MNALWVNKDELAVLLGLPYLQQVTYLLGIRPYMDRETSVVGIKRRISYQSLAEALYIEPHQGIQSGSPSRQQLRRAIKSLERIGLVKVQSDRKHLILKCVLAESDYSVQNKADTKPTSQPDTRPAQNRLVESSHPEVIPRQADRGQNAKADIPHYINNNICIVLLREQFEKFWSTYPQPQNKPKAWTAFQRLNPDEVLFQRMMNALQAQITHYALAQENGHWLPHWKYPANWIIQECWNDELITYSTLENAYEKHGKDFRTEPAKDMFWSPDLNEPERESNIIELKSYREAD